MDISIVDQAFAMS